MGLDYERSGEEGGNPMLGSRACILRNDRTMSRAEIHESMRAVPTCRDTVKG